MKLSVIRRTTLALISLCLSAGIAIAQTKRDRERANLSGVVKTVQERSYSYMGMTDYKKDNEKDRKFDTGDTVTYDKQGNEIERIMVSDYGELMGKQTQKFDTSGLLQETIFLNPKGAVQERVAYSYSHGKLTQKSTYDGKGVLRLKTVNYYDAKGDLQEEVYSDPTVARAKTVFKFDSNHKLLEAAFFLSNGEKGYAVVGPCLGAHRLTYTYDENGRPSTKSVFESDGKEKKSWTYIYDQRGNQAKQTMRSKWSTTIYDFKYEYDLVGNWIRLTTTDEEKDSISESLLQTMMKAEGKTASPEELREINEKTKMTRVTTRTITYY